MSLKCGREVQYPEMSVSAIAILVVKKHLTATCDK